MNDVYKLVKQFKSKYPITISWRIKQHSEVLEKHLNPGEEILYAFCGQKNDRSIDLFNTYVVAFTNKRIMLASKRVLFGSFFKSITPDMYNDLTINEGIIWGRVIIDTIKEKVVITNIANKGLTEIETNITEIMIKLKKEYAKEKEENVKEN